jgi:hypothetical protein
MLNKKRKREENEVDNPNNLFQVILFLILRTSSYWNTKINAS